MTLKKTAIQDGDERVPELPAATPCPRCRPGARVRIVRHPLASLTGTVLRVDRYEQIAVRIDDVECSPVMVREQHLTLLESVPGAR